MALLAAAVAAGVHLTAASAGATCSVNWTGAANDGQWSTAGNWDTNAVPTSADNVCITGSVVVSLSGSQAVNSLTLGQAGGAEPTLDIGTTNYTNAVLTTTAGLANYGTVDLDSFTSYAPATSILAGGAVTNETGATIDVLNDGGGGRQITAQLDNQGALEVQQPLSFGSVAVSNSGSVTIGDAQQVTIPAGGSFDQKPGASLAANGSGYLDDSGPLTIEGGTMSGNPVHLEAAGTLTYAVADPTSPGTSSSVERIGGGGATDTLSGDIPVGHTLAIATTDYTNAELNASAPYTNYGTIEITSATSYEPYTSTLSGASLTNAAGGTIEVLQNGGGSRQITASVDNKGTFQVANSVSFGSGALTNEGSMTIADGVVVSVPATGSLDEKSGGSIDTTGSGYLDDSGALTIEGGTMSGNPVHLESAGTLAYAVPNPGAAGSSSDVERFGGGGATGSLSGDIPVGSTLEIATTNYTDARLDAASSFTNYGTIVLSSATGYAPYNSYLSGAALTNAAGATIESQYSGGGGRQITNALTNDGTVQVDSGIGLTTSDLTNVSGSTLSGGTYDLAGALSVSNASQSITTNDAHVVLRSGGSMTDLAPTSNTGNGELDVVGRSYTVAAFANAGTVDLSSGASLSVTGDYTQSAGTTTVESGSTLSPSGQVTLDGGTLTGAGTVASAVDNAGGTVEPAAGSSPATLSVSGAYTQGAAGTLKVDVAGSSAGDFSVLAATNAASLDGALAIATDNAYTPAACSTYVIATGSSQAGTFASLSGDRPVAGIEYLPGYDASGSVTLTAAAAPDAPSGVQATAGDTSAGVSWTAPGANCSAISSYTVRAHPDGQSGTTNDVTAQVTAPATSTTLTGLTNGTTYDITVLATNAVGDGAASSAVQATPAQPAPVTTITGGPADGSSTNDASPTFTYSSDETGSTFECKVDSGSYASCPTSGDTLSNLPEGDHTFSVRAVNTDSVADPSPPSRTFTVDTTAPALTLTAPATPTADDKPGFSGSGGTASGDSGTVTVELFQGTGTGGTQVGTAQTANVDAASGAWSTPALSSALGDGTYTVEATQSDQAGNQSAKTATFTVDTTAPALTLNAPASPSADSKPSFSGTGGTASGDSGTVTVKLFQGTGTAGSQVGSAQTANVNATGGAWSTPALSSALVDGTYTVEAVQSDQAGNQTSKTATFIVDSAAPTLEVTGGPADGSLTNDASPTFSFTAGNDAVSVHCRLDSGGFRACSAAGSDALTGLADGQHTWSVEATDQAGNTATASRTFTVDTTPPGVTITSPADGASYTVGQVVDASYGCTDQNLVSCAGPVGDGAEIDTSTPGQYTFTVTATDGAGNTTSQSVSYTVAAKPATSILTVAGALHMQGSALMLPVSCAVPKGQHCVVTLTLTVRAPAGDLRRPAGQADGGRLRTIEAGHVEYRLSHGWTKLVSVRLSTRGYKLLVRQGHLAVTLSVREGSKLVATRRVTLSPKN